MEALGAGEHRVKPETTAFFFFDEAQPVLL